MAGGAEASLAPSPQIRAPGRPGHSGSCGQRGSPRTHRAALVPQSIALAASQPLPCSAIPFHPPIPQQLLPRDWRGWGAANLAPSPQGMGHLYFCRDRGFFSVCAPQLRLCPTAAWPGDPQPPGAQRALPVCVPLCSHCVPSPLPAHPCPFPVPSLSLPCPSCLATSSDSHHSPLQSDPHGEGGLERETEAGEEGTGTCGTAGDRPWLPALAEMEIQRRAWKPPEIFAGGGGSAGCAAVRVPRGLQPPAPRCGCRKIWGAPS